MNSDPEIVGVWVGLRPDCGCCVAVVVDDKKSEHALDLAKTKRDFLDSGLSVVYAPWSEWQSKYLPSMQADCTHKTAAPPSPETARSQP